MLTTATNIAEAMAASGNYRAGGTDYMDRLRHEMLSDEIVDLQGIGLNQIETDSSGATTIGAMTTVFNLSQTPYIRDNYPALAQAAGALATPQIRQMATVGGNLTQATRCQYYRHSELDCTKKGDAKCGGREGYHPNGVIFDNGGCAHPHPSTLGMALIAYNAEIEINGESKRPITNLYGDGSDTSRDHLLSEGELITAIILPSPQPEKSAYFRASQRARAEWATIECVARLHMAGDRIKSAEVAVGAVGPVPLRMAKVEEALAGSPTTEEAFVQAAALAAEGATPLRENGYKVQLMVMSIAKTLGQAAGLE